MAIKDNLQQKIDKARNAGYSDSQIQSYLKSQGISVPSGYTQRVAEDFVQRRQTIEEINKAQIEGKQSLPETVLQHAGQIAGGGTDIISEIPGIKQGLEFVGKGIQAGMAVIPDPIKDKAVDVYKSLPENIRRDLEAGLDIVSLLPAGKAAEVGIKGSTRGLELGVKGAEIGTTVAGRATKGVGKALYERAITPVKKEAERILTYEAKTPFLTRVVNVLKGEPMVRAPITRASTALEKGIMGTEKMVGIQAKRIADNLWEKTIAPAVKESKAVISKNNLFEPVIERIAKTAEPGRKKALQDAFEAILDDYKAIENLTLEEAQAIKRGLDEFTPDKIFKGKSVASEYATLKNDMANAIRQKTYEALEDVNIKKDYLDYGNLKQLEDVGIKAITEGGLKGGFGSFWSTMWDKATTPIKTIGGQTLYRVGDVLEFVGENGIKNFGEYLKSKGFLRTQ